MNIEIVRREVQRAAAPWEPKDTQLSRLPPEELRKRLGYVPGPGERTLLEHESGAKAKLSVALAAVAAAARPASFDWRNRNGGNFITPVRDQGSCGSCVAFGTLAVMEAQIQISRNDPNTGIDLAEADLFYCIAEAQQSRACDGANGGWWPTAALAALVSDGVVDEACFPYVAGDQPCNRCADWQNRKQKIVSSSTLTSAEDMKVSLSSAGPLVTTISVYEDFAHYASGVYKHVTGALEGGHCIAVVGYDDGQSAWIIKNSWGTTDWGIGGFGLIGYGEVGVDDTMYGITV